MDGTVARTSRLPAPSPSAARLRRTSPLSALMNTQQDRESIQKLLAAEPGRTWRPAEICSALHFRGKQIKQL